MTVLIGPVWAATVLLLVAGVSKLGAPGPTVAALRTADLPATRHGVRLLGVIEVVAATSLLLRGGAVAAAGVALLYAGFSGFLVRLRSRAGDGADCGCLGAQPTPVTRLHIGVDLSAAVVAGIAVVIPLPGARTVLEDAPWQGIPTVVALVVVVVLLRLLLRDLPVIVREMRRLRAAVEVSR